MGTQILISGGGSTFKLEGTNYLSVLADGTPTENGQAVRDAYTTAQAMTPNGAALSATNRVVILLAPGYYDFDEGVLGDWYIDQSFIDFESLSGVPDVYFSSIQLISSGIGINVRISGIDTTKNSYYTTGPFAVACSAGINESIYIRDCVGGDYSFVTFSSGFNGTIDNCIAGNYSFGYINDTAPAGNWIVGGNTQLYGTFKNCIAGNYSFLSSQSTGGGAGQVTNMGTIDNCRAGSNSFVYSIGDIARNNGTISNCESTGNKSFCVSESNFGVDQSGLIVNCRGRSFSFVVGYGFGNAVNSGSIIDCYSSQSDCFCVGMDFANYAINYGTMSNCVATNSGQSFCGSIGTHYGIMNNCISSSFSFCCDNPSGIYGDIYRCTMSNDTFTVAATGAGRVVLGIDTTGVVNY